MQIYALRFEEILEENSHESKESLVDSWQLIDVNEDGIELLLSFKNPVFISADDYPDILFVQLELEDLDTKSGAKFLSGVLKSIPIPP